jgi:hypothetical protein
VLSVQKVVKNMVVLISSLLLLASTVLRAAHTTQQLEVQLALVTLAVLPAILGLASTLKTHTARMGYDPYLHLRRKNLEHLADFKHRKEVSLLGLRSWVFTKWRIVAKAAEEERSLMASWNWTCVQPMVDRQPVLIYTRQQFSIICGSIIVTTTFQLFLALGLFREAVSLGSAALLQSLATQCIDSLAEYVLRAPCLI